MNSFNLSKKWGFLILLIRQVIFVHNTYSMMIGDLRNGI